MPSGTISKASFVNDFNSNVYNYMSGYITYTYTNYPPLDKCGYTGYGECTTALNTIRQTYLSSASNMSASSISGTLIGASAAISAIANTIKEYGRVRMFIVEHYHNNAYTSDGSYSGVSAMEKAYNQSFGSYNAGINANSLIISPNWYPIRDRWYALSRNSVTFRWDTHWGRHSSGRSRR